MKRILLLFAPIFGILLSAEVCQADILFLDLNNAPAEIAAAREAAVQRHEKLIIVPTRTADEQKTAEEVKRLEAEREKLFRAVSVKDIELSKLEEELWTAERKPSPNSKNLAALRSKLKVVMVEQDKINRELLDYATQLKPLNSSLSKVKFSIGDFRKTLDSLEKAKTKVSTLIISGEHGGDTFWGSLSRGMIHQDAVVDAIKAFPHVAQSIQSVYGWGCYTATPYLGEWWKSQLPNIKLVGGFDGPGPESSRSVSEKWLKGLLVKEASVVQLAEDKKTKGDVQQIARVVKAIPGFDMTNAGVCTRAACVGINTGVLDLSKLSKSCDQSAFTFLEGLSQSQFDLNNPPCDTQSSGLRIYYSRLREVEHCSKDAMGDLREKFSYQTSKADQVLRRIYEKQIYSNYVNYNASDFEKLNASLKRCGLPAFDIHRQMACGPDAPEAPNNSLNRAALYKLVHQSVDCSASDAQSMEDTDSIHTMLTRLGGQLHSHFKCIPLSWVDAPAPGTSLEPPPSGCQ